MHLLNVCRPVPTQDDVDGRLVVHDNYTWPIVGGGYPLHIRFMDGENGLRKAVETHAKTWTEYANINLIFDNAVNAEIRITFSQVGQSWSSIGTDSQRITTDKPTMNLWLTAKSTDIEIKRVVLHEFGHVLGCLHEHMNPDAGIKWKKKTVYDYYAALNPPWSAQDVDDNILKVYSTNQTSHTKFDPASIMIYPIPKEFTENFSADWNDDLSQTDINFIRQKYP